MILTFRATLLAEGARCYAPVPINLWKKTGLKGNERRRLSSLVQGGVLRRYRHRFGQNDLLP